MGRLVSGVGLSSLFLLGALIAAVPTGRAYACHSSWHFCKSPDTPRGGGGSTGVIVDPGPTPQEEARQLAARADAEFQAGRLDQAIALYDAALAKFRDAAIEQKRRHAVNIRDGLALNDQGREAEKTGDWGGAVFYYKAALEKYPHPIIEQNLKNADAAQRQDTLRREALALNDQGVALYKSGEWAKAAEAFRAAIEKQPGDQVMRQNLENAEGQLRSHLEQERLEAEREAKAQRDAAAVRAMGKTLEGLATALRTPSPEPTSSAGKLAFPRPAGGAFDQAEFALERGVEAGRQSIDHSRRTAGEPWNQGFPGGFGRNVGTPVQAVSGPAWKPQPPANENARMKTHRLAAEAARAEALALEAALAAERGKPAPDPAEVAALKQSIENTRSKERTEQMKYDEELRNIRVRGPAGKKAP